MLESYPSLGIKKRKVQHTGAWVFGFKVLKGKLKGQEDGIFMEVSKEEQICRRATTYHRQTHVWSDVAPQNFSPTHSQPWHSFSSACTPPPPWPQHLTLHYVKSPHPPPPPLHPSHYQERISLCKQNCWVLLVAEIRWGCELSPNICSLEWRRRGEKRRGDRMRVVHSMCVSCMFWMKTHTHTHTREQAIIQINALYLAERFISRTQETKHTFV